MKHQNETLTARCKKNTVNQAIWTVSWLITMALVAFGHKYLWDYNTTLSVIFIAVNVLIGIGMIVANIRYINALDEMQRKIHLEAMGISLGVTIIMGLGYSMLDITNVISYDAEISHLVVITALTYMGGIFINNFRYK
ncbi:hypothetical protein [Gramella sp. KN1008]|uniref:hypothetical protein n=1 Tax=Gramella sp. KN1008 TaxID=2529298 RepID=UPI00103FEC53|nr:hypothetical protein [Gramella sp. KN1008]TBW27164.1 hypothetical protein EZJ28_12740 [Gramella sp. KN1008]